jgi:hypothetical protein
MAWLDRLAAAVGRGLAVAAEVLTGRPAGQAAPTPKTSQKPTSPGRTARPAPKTTDRPSPSPKRATGARPAAPPPAPAPPPPEPEPAPMPEPEPEPEGEPLWDQLQRLPKGSVIALTIDFEDIEDGEGGEYDTDVYAGR